jgi:hypothetical protein
MHHSEIHNNSLRLSRIKMQKVTVVLLLALLAVASATSKFKRLTPINPEPQCSLLEIAMCAEEIAGTQPASQKDRLASF